MSFYDLSRYFIVYAFFGWCIEVAYAAVKKGEFVNRGFLNGPVCPIYGYGMLTVLLVLSGLKHNLMLLFAGSVILTSALEYITGFALEKIFNDKWWDYSNCRYNLKGYICLKFSLAWGAACVFAVCVVHPFVGRVLNLVPHGISMAFFGVIYAVFAIDVSLTVAEALRIKKYFKNADKVEKHIKSVSDTVGEEITDAVLRAEKFYEEIAQRRKMLQQAGDDYKIDLRKGNEFIIAYNKMKEYAQQRGYIFNRLSHAFPQYFEKNAVRIKEIKKFMKSKMGSIPADISEKLPSAIYLKEKH